MFWREGREGCCWEEKSKGRRREGGVVGVLGERKGEEGGSGCVFVCVCLGACLCVFCGRRRGGEGDRKLLGSDGNEAFIFSLAVAE